MVPKVERRVGPEWRRDKCIDITMREVSLSFPDKMIGWRCVSLSAKLPSLPPTARCLPVPKVGLRDSNELVILRESPAESLCRSSL